MTSPIRGKAWGYEVEVQAETALQAVPGWSGLKRTGASSQKVKDYPDLLQAGDSDPYILVVTKDKGRHSPLLVTLPVADLVEIAAVGITVGRPVLVQVKARSESAAGNLFKALRTWVQNNRKVWQGITEKDPQHRYYSEARGL